MAASAQAAVGLGSQSITTMLSPLVALALRLALRRYASSAVTAAASTSETAPRVYRKAV